MSSSISIQCEETALSWCELVVLLVVVEARSAFGYQKHDYQLMEASSYKEFLIRTFEVSDISPCES